MSNVKDINFDYIPKWKAGGARLIVKVDRPPVTKLGNIEIDPLSGKTSNGLFIEQKANQNNEEAHLAGQMRVKVHSIGGCAFYKEGLTDFQDTVKVGSIIYIDLYSGKPILDEFGQRTLYYWVWEHNVCGTEIEE